MRSTIRSTLAVLAAAFALAGCGQGQTIVGEQGGGGGESTGGLACGACHGTILQGMNGTVARTSAHRLALDPSADDSTAWTGPLSGVAEADRSCVNMCHGDHPHDLTNPVVSTHEYNVFVDARTKASRGANSTTRDATNRAKTDYVAPGTNPSGGLCLSCHQDAVDAARPALSIAGFDASAHNATATVGANSVTYDWQYQLHLGTFDRNCTKCHASRAEGTTPAAGANGSGTTAVHSNSDPTLLAGTKNPGGSAAGFVCYNCHGSTVSPAAGAQGDRSSVDVQSEVTKAHAHPVNADTVHDSAAELANASFGNALGVAAGAGQRHVNCLDCHDPHQAQAGDRTAGQPFASPQLQGAWGAAFVGPLDPFAAPTTAAYFAKTVITAGSDLEATLCFKCHTSFYWGAGTPPTSPSGGFPETDLVKELNPANVGFHPVLASNSGTLGSTANILAPFTTTSLMTCTDCHASDDTADPNGPHGSSAGFMLKGPNTVWNNTIALTSGPMPAGTFCANCHAASFTNSRFPDHTNSSHNGVRCQNCHAAIPHGGPRPGMLIAPAGATAASGNFPGPVAGWDTAAPYSNPGSGIKLGLRSYPTAGATWDKPNCGCNSTTHP